MRDMKQEVLHFWFEETAPAQWFQKNPFFDDVIRERFGVTYDMARDGLCSAWQDTPEGALALCVVLDQFPRNMFRDSARAFEADAKALLAGKLAVRSGYDHLMPPLKRRFFYLPFEHSEQMEDQQRSLELFRTMKDDDPVGYDYAVRHFDVIKQFGRFPHRNEALGRKNTPEEEAYLAQPDSGF
jgi:uncharacterized protein (DUF924 family)